MENKDMSYFTADGMIAAFERTIHRLWVVIIILIVALVATNTAWIIWESQWEVYEETTQEVSQDTRGGGSNKFIGGDYYGTADSKNND